MIDDLAVRTEELFAVQASIVRLKLMLCADHFDFWSCHLSALLIYAFEFAKTHCRSPLTAHRAVIFVTLPASEAMLASQSAAICAHDRDFHNFVTDETLESFWVNIDHFLVFSRLQTILNSSAAKIGFGQWLHICLTFVFLYRSDLIFCSFEKRSLRVSVLFKWINPVAWLLICLDGKFWMSKRTLACFMLSILSIDRSKSEAYSLLARLAMLFGEWTHSCVSLSSGNLWFLCRLSRWH